jgi:hypothetical protein
LPLFSCPTRDHAHNGGEPNREGSHDLMSRMTRPSCKHRGRTTPLIDMTHHEHLKVRP